MYPGVARSEFEETRITRPKRAPTCHTVVAIVLSAVELALQLRAPAVWVVLVLEHKTTTGEVIGVQAAVPRDAQPSFCAERHMRRSTKKQSSEIAPYHGSHRQGGEWTAELPSVQAFERESV